MGNLFSGIGGLILFILDIWAIASVINSDAERSSKIIWTLVVAVIGLLIWLWHRKK